VTVSSRLSQALEVKIFSSRSLQESDTQLSPGGALASFVCAGDDVKAVRVRLCGNQNPWSQEITFKDQDRESKLVKVSPSSPCVLCILLHIYVRQLSTHDKQTVMHVWCHLFAQVHSDYITKATEKQHLVRVM
jgi:hypothetical protein